MDMLIDADKKELEKSVRITMENNKRHYSLEQWARNVISFYTQI